MRQQGLTGLIRCPLDGAVLRPGDGATDRHTCTDCGRAYATVDGVMDLTTDHVSDETEFERRVRDAEAHGVTWDALDQGPDFMGVATTLSALGVRPDHIVLELGAGTGRFTRLLIPACSGLVAVDISRSSLEVISNQLGGTEHVLLVQADASTAFAAPAAFDRVLSTLVSNLPDTSRREFYRHAARVLRPDGRLVFTVHHNGPRARLNGEPVEGRYEGNDIYRRLFTRADIVGEVSRCFGEVRVRPISVNLPLTPRLGARAEPLNRWAEQVPLLRSFGQLLLVDAREPMAG